jgi:lauroyl/myristoyl acyltransferase
VQSRSTEPLPLGRSATARIKQRLVRSADLREAALFVLFGPTGLLLPVRWWPRIANVMHRARRGLKKRRLPFYAARFRAVFGESMSPAAIRDWYRRAEQHADRKRLYTVTSYLSRRWQPDIALSGEDAITAALAAGRGVILWFDSFVHANLVAKRALAGAGCEIHFLSSRYHGVSVSWFGQKFLNPVYVDAEMQYLRERIVLHESNQTSCTRRMWTVLRQNGIVGVTNGVSSNMRFIETPFGTSARLALPTTILSLALESGAPILPIAALEVTPLREYTVLVGPAIMPDASIDKRAAMERAARQYANWLLPLVRDNPEQWTGWKSSRLV